MNGYLQRKNPQTAVFALWLLHIDSSSAVMHHASCKAGNTHTIDSLTKTNVYMHFSILFMDLFSLSFSHLSSILSSLFSFYILIVSSQRSFRFLSTHVFVCVSDLWPSVVVMRSRSSPDIRCHINVS